MFQPFLTKKSFLLNEDDENSGNYDLCCYLETEHGVVFMGSKIFISSKDFSLFKFPHEKVFYCVALVHTRMLISIVEFRFERQ